MRRAIALAALLAAASLAGLAATATLADSVTMRARATVLRSEEAALGVFGAISSGAEGEYVAVLGKECGVPGAFFRALGGATTTAGGAWEASIFIRTKTTLRAEWKDAQSATVVVTPRAYLTLTKQPRGFRVVVGMQTGSADGKRVVIERLTPGGWKKLQTVVVESDGYAPFAEKSRVQLKVPKGTTLRAVLPRSQTGACYLAGYSKLVRT
ncbi:MAG TPA: hypothetical protein VFR32_00225 [Gaiellaceae bacterium]|nr:hypothetical protein [Gaiellaceae bacterium]